MDIPLEFTPEACLPDRGGDAQRGRQQMELVRRLCSSECFLLKLWAVAESSRVRKGLWPDVALAPNDHLATYRFVRDGGITWEWYCAHQLPDRDYSAVAHHYNFCVNNLGSEYWRHLMEPLTAEEYFFFWCNLGRYFEHTWKGKTRDEICALLNPHREP